MFLRSLKAIVAGAPRPLVISFGVLFTLDLVFGLFTFQLTVLIRWAISWALMYAILKGDKIWASVYAGLLFIGGLVTYLMFFSRSFWFAVPFVLTAWGLAAYILFSPSMKKFFLAKSALRQINQK